MPKKLFYVCAALLCLGLAYQLGTVQAWARGGGLNFVAICEGIGTDSIYAGLSGTLAITTDGEVYFRPAGSPRGFRWIHESSLAVTGVIAMSEGRGQDGTSGTRVFLSDGNVYYRRGISNASWGHDSFIGSSGVVAIGYGKSTTGYTSDLALTDAGEVFARPDAYPCCNTWQLDSNIPSEATPTVSSTWGALKARYR